jgi:16S rRNA (cytidine1402-2'-O)-methyltransferase
METVWGKERPITVARELTKVHQEIRRGSIGETKDYFSAHPPRGEICLLIPAVEEETKEINWDQIMKETIELINNGIEKKEAFKMKAREYKVQKSTIYKRLIDN